jgi:hypothetical protein
MAEGGMEDKKLSRRDFLKGVAATGAAAAIEGTNLQQAEARELNSQEIQEAQTKMREALTHVIQHFRGVTTNLRLDSIPEKQRTSLEGVAKILEDFSVAAESAMQGASTGRSTDRLGRDLERVFSQRAGSFDVTFYAQGVLEYVQLVLKLIDLAFLDVDLHQRGRALNERLTTLHQELESLLRQYLPR